ncbi:MAG: efflux RND transporter permease subunit [Hydrogenophilus sp.]|nr:efflux RND transporter permease subunit [Hydrogenophilus sp.]
MGRTVLAGETTGAPLGISGRVAATFQRNAITPLLALVLFLLGLFAILVTPKEEEPQIDVTMAHVIVPWPGASAKDVESIISRPAELVLSRIAGVEHVFSVSRPGMALLTVQFEVGVKSETALVRLYDTVMSHRDWLSPNLGVGEPIVKPKGIDDVPVAAFTLYTTDPERAGYDLERVAHALELELKRIPGARDVRTIGGPGQVVRVVFDPVRLNAYNLTVSELKKALAVTNVSLPAGYLTQDNREVLVRTGLHFESVEDVASIVVGVVEGRPVYLREVAEVTLGPDEPRRYVWYGRRDGASYPAVTIWISKKPGANAASVVEAAVKRMRSLEQQLIPEGVEWTITRDYGATATDKANTLIGKLIFATAAVVGLVLLTLGWREAVIVGVAVTLTLMATLFASWAWGFTLNRVSLFALIFSIGILVDDAIVVVENVHRWHYLKPAEPLGRVIPHAVDEVGGPTILATFTVIAALLPMAFVTGLMGPYMSPIPVNASMGMFLSLVVAFVVTPWLADKLLRPHEERPGGDDRVTSALDRFFRTIFRPIMHPLYGAWVRFAWGSGVLVLIAAAMALPVMQVVILKMLPFDNKSEFQVVVEMPLGTPPELTSRALQEMGEALAAAIPEVRDWQAYAGTASPINFNGLVRQYYLRQMPEQGDLQVNLVDRRERKRKSHEVAMAARPVVQAIAARYGANAKVVEVPPGPPVLAPIVAEIYGPSYEGQIAVAQQVRAALERTPDVVDVDDTIEEVAPELVLVVNQAKAAQKGVAQAQIVETIRVALSGESATSLYGGSNQYEVPVRLMMSETLKDQVDQVLALRVRSREGQLVPISELVDVVERRREQVIYRKDLLPVVFVMADVAGETDSPLYGMFQARTALAGIPLIGDGLSGTLGEWFIQPPENPYSEFSVKWDGEWQVTYETFRDMGAAYAVGLVLIYLLVVAHFKSYGIPLIIMAPIPLTIIGVMPGHALLGAQFTATSMIGMIALAGIIVRNSILLVDFVIEQVKNGMALEEAIVRSAAVRAKPIALTAVAAMIGALFILDDPIFQGLAISLIFGVFVSTVLTLVVIPMLFYAAKRGKIEVIRGNP